MPLLPPARGTPPAPLGPPAPAGRNRRHPRDRGPGAAAAPAAESSLGAASGSRSCLPPIWAPEALERTGISGDAPGSPLRHPKAAQSSAPASGDSSGTDGAEKLQRSALAPFPRFLSFFFAFISFWLRLNQVQMDFAVRTSRRSPARGFRAAPPAQLTQLTHLIPAVSGKETRAH